MSSIFICPKCGKRFVSQGEYNIHFVYEHKKKDLANNFQSAICFHCCEIFRLDWATVCDKCGWHKCTVCGKCLCQLSDEGRRVAIAMFLTYKSLDLHEFNYWYKKLMEVEGV